LAGASFHGFWLVLPVLFVWHEAIIDHHRAILGIFNFQFFFCVSGLSSSHPESAWRVIGDCSKVVPLDAWSSQAQNTALLPCGRSNARGTRMLLPLLKNAEQ